MQDEKDKVNHDDESKWLFPTYMADHPYPSKTCKNSLNWRENIKETSWIFFYIPLADLALLNLRHNDITSTVDTEDIFNLTVGCDLFGNQ